MIRRSAFAPARVPALVPALVLLGASLVAGATAFPRSDPVGVYAIVDRVVLEPDAAHPKTVQIWGVFALTEGKPGDNYRPAERGYLYFSVDPRNERVTLAEWNDLASVAGKGQAVGFGAKYRTSVRLRHATEAPANPDAYPSGGIGVVKVLKEYLGPQIEQQLKAVPPAPKPAPPKKP